MRKEFVQFIENNEKTKDTSLKCMLVLMAIRYAKESKDATYLDKLIKDDVKEAYTACAYIYKKDEKANIYYEKLLKNIKKIDTTNMDTALKTLPFYMLAETELGKKEHYQDIAVRYTELTAKLTSDKADASQIAKYLFAVITTVEYMSEQLFEYYMALADMFKKALKKNLKVLEKEDKNTKILTAFALERACDMRIILREKYQAVIDELLV